MHSISFLKIFFTCLSLVSSEVSSFYYRNPPQTRGVIWTTRRTVQEFRSVDLIREETRDGNNELMKVDYLVYNRGKTLKIVMVSFLNAWNRPAESVVKVAVGQEALVPSINKDCKDVVIKVTN